MSSRVARAISLRLAPVATGERHGASVVRLYLAQFFHQQIHLLDGQPPLARLVARVHLREQLVRSPRHLAPPLCLAQRGLDGADLLATVCAVTFSRRRCAMYWSTDQRGDVRQGASSPKIRNRCPVFCR